MRTKAIFRDLPFHLEYEMGSLPIIPIGFVVQFEISIRDKENSNKSHEIDGNYEVVKVKNVYDTGSGLIQYLEFLPARY